MDWPMNLFFHSDRLRETAGKYGIVLYKSPIRNFQMEKLVVIGASAGGIEALVKIIETLPGSFRAPILVVVHVSENHESALPAILNRTGSLPAVHPYNGQAIEPGKVYVAPPGLHMVVIDDHIQLKYTPRENRHRPAIDPLFRSAARIHGNNVIGIILSGALDDGTAGLMAIKEHGGFTIAQDPDDALFNSMPESACRYVEIDYVLPASKIADTLVHLSNSINASVTDEGDTTAQERIDIIDSKEVMMHELNDQPGELTPYSCPECSGNLWTATQNGFAQYWCHIGHRYTKRTLLSEKTNKAEEGLLTAFRALKESVVIAGEIADEANKYNDSELAAGLKNAAENWKQQLDSIYQIVNKQD